MGQKPAGIENIYRGSLPMDDESFDLVASLACFMQNASDDVAQI